MCPTDGNDAITAAGTGKEVSVSATCSVLGGSINSGRKDSSKGISWLYGISSNVVDSSFTVTG